MPGSLAIIGASFDSARRGRAIGIWSGASSVASGLGLVLGGWLVDRASWRAVFFLNLPLAAATVAIALWKVPESRDRRAGLGASRSVGGWTGRERRSPPPASAG